MSKQSLILTIFISGLVLVLVGSGILLAGSQSPNFLSDLFTAIFTIMGAILGYLQLFFTPPFFDLKKSPKNSNYPYQTADSTQSSDSASSFLIYFRLSGIVLIISDIIFAVTTLLPYSLYTPTFASRTSLISGITILLFSVALPALQMLRPDETRRSGLSGVVVLCASALFFAAYYFLSSIDPYQDNYPLFCVANALQVIGSILLGIAIIRKSPFSQWTGVLLIISGIVFIGLFIVSLSNTALYIINNAAVLPGCIAFIGCGYTLLRQNKGSAAAGSSSFS